MRKILRVSIFAVCLAVFGCRDAAKNYQVVIVDRSHVYSLDKKPDPLLLVVRVTEEGKLSLNKIETGTISDLTDLSGKIEAIFEDREKTGVHSREVLIDPRGNVRNEDLKKLIESIAVRKAQPIRVIKNDLSKFDFE